MSIADDVTWPSAATVTVVTLAADTDSDSIDLVAALGAGFGHRQFVRVSVRDATSLDKVPYLASLEATEAAADAADLVANGAPSDGDEQFVVTATRRWLKVRSPSGGRLTIHPSSEST